jgi:transcriptional regulator with XRE-family HTH domain
MADEGVSQKEIASEMEVTQPQISRILSGKFTSRSELAGRLCHRFGVPPLDAHLSAADRAIEAAKLSLHTMWDGTASGAQHLRQLLEAVRCVSLRKTPGLGDPRGAGENDT